MALHNIYTVVIINLLTRKKEKLTLSPPNTELSMFSLLYSRGRYYTSLE